MSFSLAPDFLAKTQRPGDESLDEFSFPALTEFVRDQEEDSLLCPVRAVRSTFGGLRIVVLPVLGFLLRSQNQGELFTHIRSLCGFAKCLGGPITTFLKKSIALRK